MAQGSKNMKIIRDSRRKKQQIYRRRRTVAGILVVCLFLVICLLVYSLFFKDKGKPQSSVSLSSSSSSSVDSSSASSSGSTSSSSSSSSKTSSSSSVPPSSSSSSIPVGGGVNAEFFNNTAFLGDSRVEGLSYYCGSDVPGASFFTSRGIMLDGVSSKKAITTTTGQQLTMIEALGQKQYKKVYMMFGVNELGWPYEDVFQRHYEDVIKLVKQSQPGAEIYVMGIFPVTAKKSSSGTIYTNEKIDRFDARVKAAAAACNVHYISVRPALVDESGVLPAAASSDGVHLNAQYCYKWLNYLSKNS